MILWEAQTINLHPSSIEKDKVTGHWGDIQGCFTGVERRLVFLGRRTSMSKDMEMRLWEYRSEGATNRWGENVVLLILKNLAVTGEGAKSLDQENGLVKVPLMLRVQISQKLGRYHERKKWTRQDYSELNITWSFWGAVTIHPWKIILQKYRSSVATLPDFSTEISIFMWYLLICNADNYISYGKRQHGYNKYTSKYRDFKKIEIDFSKVVDQTS